MLTAKDYLGDLGGGSDNDNGIIYATIDKNHVGGRPRLYFDLKPTELSTKRYPYLSIYYPKAGERVICVLKAGDIVILGSII